MDGDGNEVTAGMEQADEEGNEVEEVDEEAESSDSDVSDSDGEAGTAGRAGSQLLAAVATVLLGWQASRHRYDIVQSGRCPLKTWPAAARRSARC